MEVVYRVAVLGLLAGLLAVQLAILQRMPANLGDVEAAQGGSEAQIRAANRRTAVVKVYGDVGVSAVEPLPVKIEQ